MNKLMLTVLMACSLITLPVLAGQQQFDSLEAAKAATIEKCQETCVILSQDEVYELQMRIEQYAQSGFQAGLMEGFEAGQETCKKD